MKYEAEAGGGGGGKAASGRLYFSVSHRSFIKFGEFIDVLHGCFLPTVC